MAKNNDQASTWAPVAQMEQGAYHAIQEWPVFLMLRIRQLEPNLASVGALPEGSSIPPAPVVTVNETGSQVLGRVAVSSVDATFSTGGPPRPSENPPADEIESADDLGFDANVLLGLDPEPAGQGSSSSSFGPMTQKPAWLSRVKGQPERTEMVRIADIKRDGGTQVRVKGCDPKTVEQYAALIRDGVEFPPVVVFWDGECRWLADGFHRIEAHELLKRTEIKATILEGSRRDAIIYSVGERGNGAQAVRYSREDQRNIISMMLMDAEFNTWPNGRIATVVGVDPRTVQGVRDAMVVKGK